MSDTSGNRVFNLSLNVDEIAVLRAALGFSVKTFHDAACRAPLNSWVRVSMLEEEGKAKGLLERVEGL